MLAFNLIRKNLKEKVKNEKVGKNEEVGKSKHLMANFANRIALLVAPTLNAFSVGILQKFACVRTCLGRHRSSDGRT